MNDQASHMMINPSQIMNQHLPPLPPPQVMNQQSQLPPVQVQVQSQPMMLNRSYNNNINNNNNNNKQPQQPNLWPLQQQLLLQQNPNKIGNFGSSKPRSNNNNNWKGKKITDKRNKQISNTGMMIMSGGACGGGGGGLGGGSSSIQGYNPPTLHELQSQNRQKTRKFFSNKKKFNNNNNNNRFAPYAPRNTTSFIIRAKKSGGIASLVSPCPVTPAVLPTPIFSPSREVLGDMAKEEWGVDGYGSMKGLIRLRSGNELENEHEEDDDDDGNGSSESDVEEHVEVERRLDHDLSRFEMIYPNYSSTIGGDYNNVLENRVDDQHSQIAQLEDENLTLKERLFLMEREMADLRRRMQLLERQSNHQHQGCMGVDRAEDANEEVVENGSDNESENGSDIRENKEGHNEDVCMDEGVPYDAKKNEEVAVRNKFVLDGMIAKEDGQRKIEGEKEEVGRNELGNDDMIAKEDEQRKIEGEKEEVARNEIGNDDMIAKDNGQRKIEEPVSEMVVEDEFKGKEEVAGNGFEEDEVKVVAVEKQERKDEQVL